MSVSVIWGSYTLPAPDDKGIDIRSVFIGSARRMIDGTMRADLTTNKLEITIPWTGLTAAERSTLENAFDANADTPTDLTLTNGKTITVVAVNGWKENVWHDKNDVELSSITITFGEV